MTDQSVASTKVLFGEPMDFTGAPYKSRGKRLITSGEMPQRQLLHQNSPQQGATAHRN